MSNRNSESNFVMEFMDEKIRKVSKTVKLYDLDAYKVEFHAHILGVYTNVSEGTTILILDQSSFFPEEGGQSSDLGMISGFEVIDVQSEQDVIKHTICHKGKAMFLKEGDEIHGVVDWEHRFSNMQQHTGEHIFCGIVNKEFGYQNVGFHLSDHIVTMDFDGELTKDEIERIERSANQAIFENVEVDARYFRVEDVKGISYRSKKEVGDLVRLVSIEGYDVCACCAPHVKRTGEIGLLKIVDFKKHRGGMRLSLLCGKRALLDYRLKQDLLLNLSIILSEPNEKIADHVLRLKESMQKQKEQIIELNKVRILNQIAGIPKEQKDVFLFEDELDPILVRDTVNELMEQHDGIIGVFSQTEINTYRFVIGSKNVDIQKTAKSLREDFAAKCGGNMQMIQGTIVAEKEKIQDYFFS